MASRSLIRQRILGFSCRHFAISVASRLTQNRVLAPMLARVSAGPPSPRLAVTAGHHRGRRVSAPKLLLLHFACTVTTAACCLTPRSSRAPTAWHAGHQAQGLRPTMRLLSSAPRCRCRLNSNVRQRKVPVLACLKTDRPGGLVFTRSSLNVAGSLPPLPSPFSTNSARPHPRPSASASPRERGPAVPAACHHRRPPPWLARERANVAPAALRLHLPQPRRAA